ncbi:MAG: amidohydrolase/deacetylase family metallohydrolase [Dehalococcoidia bacterium]|nr:amidohydrolase/deacetylase family metallohydrolase [Dehalococcoidia bacterium]
MVISGGRVIDPAQGVDGIANIGISKGRIVTSGEGLKEEDAAQVIAAQGKIVVPGLIDFHAHVYDVVTSLGLAPDRIGINAGVTTVVDAGSAGSDTFPGLPRFVLPQNKTSVFCFLHICRTGLCHLPEMRDWNDIDYEATVAMVQAYPDLIKGIKVRVVEPVMWNMGLELIKLSKRIAKEVALPLMVHVGDPKGVEGRSLTKELLPLLDSGDILSHCFTCKPGRVLQPDGSLMPEFREAVERGVVLDIARGNNGLSFDVAQQMLEQGILPDTISTDLAALNINGTVYSLLHTISAFLALGLSLNQVIEMTTTNPANAMKEGHRLGSLKDGMPANVSVLEMGEGDWEFRDSENQPLEVKLLLKPVVTVKDGVPFLASPAGTG